MVRDIAPPAGASREWGIGACRGYIDRRAALGSTRSSSRLLNVIIPAIMIREGSSKGLQRPVVLAQLRECHLAASSLEGTKQ